MIENVEGVLSYFGHGKSSDLSRVFYKHTECGAWVKVEYRDAKGFLTIGSIVEGSDAEVVPRTLEFPFSAQDLARAIADVEMDAEDLWEEANC